MNDASIKVLAFAGSARKDSFNKQLVRIAAEGAAAEGAIVQVVDLAAYPLPIFDQDLEQEGTPENASKLKELFLGHDALLIACPEYNSSITPLLKNTLDWVSRSAPGESPLAAYKHKVACLLAASPGALGGLRGLVHVRAILANVGVTVLPGQIAIPTAHEAFASGKLKDDKLQQRVMDLGAALARVTKKLAG